MPTSLNGLSDVTIVKKGGVTEGSTSGASGANEVVLASDSMYIASDSAPVNASTELNQAWGNLAIGKHTLESVTTASRNIAIGNCSLKSLTTGYFEEWNTSGANIAIGEYCLENSVTGFGNIGLGYRELNADQSMMIGGNIFYDVDLFEQHQRLSMGLEARAAIIDFNYNYYQELREYLDKSYLFHLYF